MSILTRQPVGRAVMGLLALGVLAACAEREVILPGKREPIDAVLSQTAVEDRVQPGAEINENRPITLPPETNNTEAPQFEGTPAFRTVHPALSAAPALRWSTNIGEGDGRKLRITADPVVGGGRIYTLDAATGVTAVSPSGQVIWRTDLDPGRDDAGDATGGGIAYDTDTLYVSTGFGRVVALDAATGAIRWEQRLNASGAGRPMVFGDLIYLTAGDATGWAIEKTTGRVAWQTAAAETVTNVLGAPAPVLADDLVVFAFGSGELQALFRRGGLRRWDSSVLGERLGRSLAKIDDVTATPVVDDGVLYVGSQAGRTLAIDASSGDRIWTAQEGAVSPVLPVGGSVFLVSDRNELLRLDASDGSRIWGVRLPNFTTTRVRRISEVFVHHGPVLAGGRVYLASSDGVLRVFDPTDGSQLGAIEIPGGATTRPVVAGGTAYVVSKRGQLHAFR